MDPYFGERAFVSPYNFVQNNPIYRIDPAGGLDSAYTVDYATGNYKVTGSEGGDNYDVITVSNGIDPPRVDAINYTYKQQVHHSERVVGSSNIGSETGVVGIERKPGYRTNLVVSANNQAVESIDLSDFTPTKALFKKGAVLTFGALLGMAVKVVDDDAAKALAEEIGGQTLKWVASPKHMKGGHGTYMDLVDDVAEQVLNKSVKGGKQQYGYLNGKVYEFQPDNVGGYHGYPIPGEEAGASVLKKLRDLDFFDQKTYNKLRKQSELPK